jgi:hypothetical protein
LSKCRRSSRTSGSKRTAVERRDGSFSVSFGRLVYRGELTRTVNINGSDEAGSVSLDILQKGFEPRTTIDKDHHQLGRDFLRNRSGVEILRRVEVMHRLFFRERFEFLILIDADEIPELVVRQCGFPREAFTRFVVVRQSSNRQFPKACCVGVR